MAYSHFMNDDPDTTSAISPLFDTSALKTLDASQGAHITDRTNAHEAADRAHENAERRLASKKRLRGKHAPTYARHAAPKTRISGRQVAVLAVVVVVVCAAVFFGVRAALESIEWNDGTASEEVAEPVEERVVQADVNGTVTFNGVDYRLVQADDGTWSVAQADGSDTLFELAGTPAALILYNGAIVVPESLSDGTWDVMALTLATGSVASQVVGSDGLPVTGSGSIETVVLEDPVVRIIDSTGAVTDVALA